MIDNGSCSLSFKGAFASEKLPNKTASHNLQCSALQVREPPTPTATPEENGCHVNMAYER